MLLTVVGEVEEVGALGIVEPQRVGECLEDGVGGAGGVAAYHQAGTKRLHHPVVGDLELSYDVMELAADTGLRLAIFTAEPGSRSDEALNLLASWIATPEHEPAAPARNDVPRR
jgi:transcription regulator MmyB-like protein